MIKTIVCSGISESEKKILELALKYKIETKGYCPKNLKFNHEKFGLEKVLDEKDADFKNIKSADGLVYLSETGFPQDDCYMEFKNYCLLDNLPFCFLDISSAHIHKMSDKIGQFVFENGISALMFKTDAGIKSDKTELIQGIFESLIYLLLMKTNPERLISPIRAQVPDYSSSSFSVQSVVEDLLSTLPLRDRVLISKMNETELPDLLLVFGITILSKYYWPKNNFLLNDCIEISGKKNLEEFEIAEVIIKSLWKNLRKTHKIRILK
ncbi:MAG: hypothetical protein RBR53_01680 [Desulforegulaceae bacterium]|nr:hypothetical protein [Desulforegulaceae bacterium]